LVINNFSLSVRGHLCLDGIATDFTIVL